MSSVLAKRMPLRSADFRFKNVFGRCLWESRPLFWAPGHAGYHGQNVRPIGAYVEKEKKWSVFFTSVNLFCLLDLVPPFGAN